MGMPTHSIPHEEKNRSVLIALFLVLICLQNTYFGLEIKHLPKICGGILGLVLGREILTNLLQPLQKVISRILKIIFLESRDFKHSNDV